MTQCAIHPDYGAPCGYCAAVTAECVEAVRAFYAGRTMARAQYRRHEANRRATAAQAPVTYARGPRKGWRKWRGPMGAPHPALQGPKSRAHPTPAPVRDGMGRWRSAAPLSGAGAP